MTMIDKKTVVALAALATLTATAASAQGRERGGAMSDGVLTLAEATERAMAKFDRMDENGDGYISEAEIEAIRDAHEAKRAERQAKSDAPGEHRGRKHGREHHHGGGDRFTRQDTNGDGFVGRDEVEAKTRQWFDALDADADGQVTRDEMRTHHRARGGERRR